VGHPDYFSKTWAEYGLGVALFHDPLNFPPKEEPFDCSIVPIWCAIITGVVGDGFTSGGSAAWFEHFGSQRIIA